jgi:hypothetical protein
MKIPNGSWGFLVFSPTVQTFPLYLASTIIAR